MDRFAACLFLLMFSVETAQCHYYLNYTGDSAGRQLAEFRRLHRVPIGLHTTSSGEPVEVRDTITSNTDIISNQYNTDLLTHVVRERIPERLVHAKGYSAFGYFEVTHDVSKYTHAEVFNGIGKKTPVAVRFSKAINNLGGSELGNDNRGMAVKFYTKEGNLDLLGLHIPVYLYRDGIDFTHFVRAFRRNPSTNLQTLANWDFLTLRPITMHAFLWIQSDYGSPNGYRRMDGFPIHTFVINNKHGEAFYVKFNFRTEQGLANLTASENMAIGSLDADYYTRDLYNAIVDKNYPAWRLELDIMTEEDIQKVDYNPFDVTVLWKKGDYFTVPIGRLVLDETVVNHFADSEQAAFNPASLVPGIAGPVDFLYKCRRTSYNDAHDYRLGVNHNRISVNVPKYAKTYNRDGNPPLRDNEKDAPNYYPNSFNGPVPYVDESRPEKKLMVLETNAVKFEDSAYFYNHVIKDNAHRQRLAENLATTLLPVYPHIAEKSLKMLSLISEDLGKRTTLSLQKMKFYASKISTEERYRQLAQCFQ